MFADLLHVSFFIAICSPFEMRNLLLKRGHQRKSCFSYYSGHMTFPQKDE
jgi:hypothetical protein